MYYFPFPVEVQCFPAPTIANGKHDSQAVEAFTSGMSVSYQCDPGYTLIGEAQLHCTASGAWSHLAPQCEGAFGCSQLLPSCLRYVHDVVYSA